MIKPLQTIKTNISEIAIPKGRRKVDADAVSRIASSMELLGQIVPIVLRLSDDQETTELVIGAHRVAAAKKLGWKQINAVHIDGDAEDAELWEIAENLHRMELTVQERADQISRWIDITKKKQAKLISTPPAWKIKDGRGRPEGGASAAARALNIKQQEASRAAIISSIGPKAREVADKSGLTRREDRIEIGRQKTEAEQIAKARHLALKRKVDAQMSEDERASNKQYESLLNAWTRADAAVRKRFLKFIGK